jgi:hypothetical protein
VQRDVVEWADQRVAERVTWQPLEIVRIASEHGSTLTKEPDGSVIATGERPEKDTYVVTARTELKDVTAIRLELLDDDRLPKRGPGRQDNGNMHLSEFRIERVTFSNGDGAEQAIELGIAAASADFDQTNWTVQHAIDGKPKTAWGIHPEVGKSHEAIFQLIQPYTTAGLDELRITLDQNHGGSHLIGRFRLSATIHAPPVLPSALPDQIAKIVQVPREKRTEEQNDSLVKYYWRNKRERELASLPSQQLVYAAASDFTPDGGHKPPIGPRPVHILVRGDITKPGDVAMPAPLASVTGMPAEFEMQNGADESTRRAALARWITHPAHPLTWRSIVNRVWHYRFGRGIVDTPNDFGRMGALPSHPELLDWLADEFQRSGKSIKHLDRMIVTSACYRQSSADRANHSAIDADNRLLWRMNRSRLDAESVRDAILQISGRLDSAMGGPSARHFSLKPGIHVTPLVNYSEFDWSGPGSNRRSVYRFIFRTLPDPFMDSLDCADASQLTATRNVSVTPLQALVMLNNEFLLTASEQFARRLESHGDLEACCKVACELVWGRPPTEDERRELRGFAGKHGLPALGRLLFNSNEFMFVN